MDFSTFAPIAAAFDGAYWLITTIATLLSPVAGSCAAALAVVVLTVIVRAVLIPVGVSQVRAEFTRRRLAPKLQELQRRYKNNRELLQRKTMELYTSEKASPLAGCLPTLLQAPVLSLLYGLFIRPEVNGHANTLLTQHLFGVPLGTSFVSVLGSSAVWPHLVVFVALLAVIAFVAWTSRRVALRFAQPPAEGMPAAMQNVTEALSWLPLLTVVFAAFVPLAATIYLAVTTLWTLLERSVLRRALAPTS